MSWHVISLIILFGFNLLATIRVFRADLLAPQQRVLQVLLVWLVPVVGAIICLLVHARQGPAGDRTRDPNFHPADAQWDVVPRGPDSVDGD